MLYGTLPLGLAVAGFAIEHVGAVATVLALGVGLLLVALAASLHPRIRNARMPNAPKPATETETDDDAAAVAA